MPPPVFKSCHSVFIRVCHSFTMNPFLGLPVFRELYKDPRTYMCSERGHVSLGEKPHSTPSTQCKCSFQVLALPL